MAKTVKTYLYCFDDQRSFSEELKKRFSDADRYSVAVFHSAEELSGHLKGVRDHKFCKVAILSCHDSGENFEIIDHLSIEIKNFDPETGIIIIAPGENTDEVRKLIRFNIDSYIPRNANTILRVHNTVKKLMSEHSLSDFRKKRNFSLYILLAFLLISLVFAIIAYFELPMFF